MNSRQQQPPDAAPEQKRPPARNGWMKGVTIVLLLAVGVLGYAIVKQRTAEPPPAAAAASRPVQLDVLNGCGVKGAGAKFTSVLRSRGFDVVEMKNYKAFSVSHTLVIDRVGNLVVAKRVADALGVSADHVIQQINPDYFVDVSVVIGADYQSLRSAN